MKLRRYLCLLFCCVLQIGAKEQNLKEQFNTWSEQTIQSPSTYIVGLMNACVFKYVFEVLDDTYHPETAVLCQKYIPASVANKDTSKLVAPLDGAAVQRFLQGTVNFETEAAEFEKANVYFTLVYTTLRNALENGTLSEEQGVAATTISNFLKRSIHLFETIKAAHE